MNELIDKVENLKSELNSSSLILDIKECLERIDSDPELKRLLDEYSIYPREDIKNKILENSTFQEFKIKETELNLFIMEMNLKLKNITRKGSCHHESN